VTGTWAKEDLMSKRSEGSVLLEVAGVSAGYGRISVLDDISLRLDQGSIVAVLGPNGAGKTTLLRTLAGLIPARTGTIALDGKTIGTVTAHRRPRLGIAHVAEGRRLFADMTVNENLVCGGYVRRGQPDVVREQFDRVLELFPVLGEKLHQKAGRLSGGQQQMVAIGRALMCRPRVLLLDEPTVGLAPIVVDHLGVALRALRDEGVGILLVEQAVAFASGIADRVHLLANGHLTDSGSDLDFGSGNRAEIWRTYLGIHTP